MAAATGGRPAATCGARGGMKTSRGRLRIAITVDPYLPVPPKFYGGIERVVAFLADGLVKLGHDVTLYAHPSSEAGGHRIPYGAPPHEGCWPRWKELWQLGSSLWRNRKRLDVVHSFGR